jgi:predicted component of viral defense system (DUF524 family)
MGGEVEFRTAAGQEVARLKLYPERDESGPFVLEADEADEHGEAPFQVVEGAAYQYCLASSDFLLDEVPGVVMRGLAPSRVDQGRITPGLNTGRLRLTLLNRTDSSTAGVAEIEVRSSKVNYRDEYRLMLKQISERCADLLLELPSPSTHVLMPDDRLTSETICQRFAFVSSLLSSRRFWDAVQRVISLPHRRWEQRSCALPLSRGPRPTVSLALQLASACRRMPIPGRHPLARMMASVPELVTVPLCEESLDTPENRFVKHALHTFLGFVAIVRERLASEDSPGYKRTLAEARALEARLSEFLNRGFFRGISEPTRIPIGSPVLQRKGGYREVLSAWLQFDMAAKLCWSGGEDVYGAGKRDVATLYEYWVFFRLLEIVTRTFRLEPPPARTLIEYTRDGFGLQLKAGRHLAVCGEYEAGSRRLAVKFSYNRTFTRSGVDGERSYPSAGSWTERMRPDYTLSLWPAEFSETEAEMQELITHVHFDAKYRVKDLAYPLGEPDEQFLDEGKRELDLSVEKSEQARGTYRRADLLKMHAYRDAIRRSAGAYVIYPGEQSHAWLGFHEIIPGLGAFSLRPVDDRNDGSDELVEFISHVADHLSDRATQYERESYHRYKVHETSPRLAGGVELPEKCEDGTTRLVPPDESYVLVGWYKDDAHLRWILQTGRYNAPAGDRRGSLRLSRAVSGAHYLLLHGPQRKAVDGLLAITSDGPRVFSADQLKQLGYPLSTESEFYLLYDVKPHPGFSRYQWNVDALLSGREGPESAKPFPLSLAEVMAMAASASEEEG